MASALGDRARALALPLQVFVGGGAVMTLELLGSRVLAPRFGSTLYVWGSLIGVVLTALAAGAFVGGRRADRSPNGDTLSRILLLAALAAGIVPLLAPWVLDAVRGLGMDVGPLVAVVVLLGPATFLLGMATPFAIRLSADRIARVGNVSGNVYALSTAGSIVGTFATAFVLVPSFRVSTLFMFTAGALVAVAFLGLRERRSAAAAVLVLALVATPAGATLVNHSGLLLHAGGSGSVVYETDTPYHHIRVLEDRSAGDGTLRTLVMDGLRHSTAYVERPEVTTLEYVNHFHLAPLIEGDVESALFIGGGGFSGPKQFLTAYPNTTVDVVEIDPEVVRIAEEWFAAPTNDPRVRVFTEDGRLFLKNADREYDVVVLDAYSRHYVPFHLMTAEFFFELHDVLAPGGVVVSNLIAAVAGPASDILKAEVRTMEQAFAEVYVFPVRGASYPFTQNVLVVAADHRERMTLEDLHDAVRERAPPTVPGLGTYVGRMHPGLDTFGAPVLRDDFAPVEMLLNPVTRQPFSQE